MARSTTAAGLLVIGLACAAARAEVTPVIIRLTETSPSYAVPATNTLVIENGYVGENSGVSQLLIVSNASGAFAMRIDNWFRKITSLQPSLKIPGGTTLSANALSTNLDQSVTLFGLLVSPQDLYAGVPSSFEHIAQLGGGVQAFAAIPRPLPVRVKVEESADLVTWQVATNAVVTGPTGGTDFGVTVAGGGPPADFLRLNTRLRRGPGGL